MAETAEWRPALVRATKDLSPTIRAFEIVADGPFVPAPPGSHLDVCVVAHGRADVRSYSVFEADPESGYRIAVKREAAGRGGSLHMWTLGPGDALRISPPRNQFALERGRPAYLLVAGGIGITPIFPMALALLQSGAPFRLLYAARRRADLALADELAARIGDRLAVFVSEEGSRLDLPAEIARLPPGGELYICGPLRMLEAAKETWRESGRPAHQLRFETFGSSGHLPVAAFEIRIPRLGRRIEVGANRTMLEALEAAGIDMIYDCRKGECGLCALPILEVDGVVDHRDVFFSDLEKRDNAKLCTCISRVSGRSVTLDTPDR